MSVLAAPPLTPYKGLAPYEDSELDALLFFGRERETEVVVANLLASKLTVLYGPSGVGKSSILRAAVVRRLRELAPQAEIFVVDDWAGEPALPVSDGEAFLILDQLEEYFLYHDEGPLLEQLPALLDRPRVHVLIALREDALARLDAFQSRIPGVLANRLRLDHLDQLAARAAIVGPLDRWNEVAAPDDRMGIESGLVDAVLEQVAAAPEAGGASRTGRIEAPYLQLVMERLWQEERAAGRERLRLQKLRELGGATTIVRDHLLRALAELPADQQDVAASMFEHLVTPSGTKIAHRVPDLADYADVPESSLRRVLSTLTRDRIVHSLNGSDRYEIFHDVLAEPISAWRIERRLERERTAARRRQRRLAALAGASLVALAVVAGLAAWAFSERSSARAGARHARARELEATALQQLPTDPSRSVAIALAAARLEPRGAAESVLRQSIDADRSRLVVPVGVPVRAVAVSPGGDRIAVAAAHGRLVVADARTGSVQRRLLVGVHDGRLAFVDHGTELVVGSPNTTARTWSLKTGRFVATAVPLVAAEGPDGAVVLVPRRGALARVLPHVQQLASSSDGSLIAAAVADGSGVARAEVFDAGGHVLRVLPQRGISALAFSPRGTLLATAGSDGVTTLWQPRSGHPTRRLKGLVGAVRALQFSPDGSLVARAGDNPPEVWDVGTGFRVFIFIGHTNPVSALAWSPDGRVLASASLDRTTRLWRVQHLVDAGGPVATLAGDSDAVRALAFSRDGRRLVTGSDDGTARVWDAAPDAEFRVFGRRSAPVVGARWAGDAIVAASTDGAVQVFDAATHARRLLLRGGHRLTSFAAAPDGSVVAEGLADGSSLAWNAHSGARLGAVSGSAPVLAMAVSPDAASVASGDARGAVRVWDARTGRVLWSASTGGRVVDLAFSPRGDRLAAAGPGGVTVWRSSGRASRRLSFPGGATRVAFSPNGLLLGAGGEDGEARLWSVADDRSDGVFRGHRAAVTDLVFSRDGAFLATSSRDHDGRIWSVAERRTLHVLRGHFGPVAAIALSPDGAWAATAGPISAGLWPAATGQLSTYIRGHTQLLTSVSFSPDGRTILSSSRDGTIGTYACDVCVDLDGLMRLAEQRLARTR